MMPISVFGDAQSSLPDEMALSGVTLPFSFATLLFLFGLFAAPLLALYVANRPVYVPEKIPGPPRLPVFGILLHALKHWNQWPVETMRFSRKFNHVTWGGPCFKYGALFYTDDPTIVEHILKKNFQNYEKGDVWRTTFDELLGKGIFAADGVAWESHRKIFSRVFSRNLLKHSCQVFARNCSILVEQLEKAASESQAIDLQDLFLRLTIDNTAEATFGSQLNCLRSEKQPLFARAFDEIQFLCLARFVDPLFEIKRFFQLGHRERRIRHLKSVLDLFCKGIIQEKRQAILHDDATGRKDDAGHEDLIGLFLKYSKHSNENLVDEELRDVILNFMLAGRDTTAAGLSWTFYELTKHPDIVDKVVAEINEICGPIGSADYSFDNLSKLTYTHCVAMEGLRLHPPVPIDTKFAIHNDTWPDGTHIPAGSMVNYSIFSMGWSESIWGPDAAEFNPERFLNSNEPSPFRFSAFNAGPRMCLGKPLALMTMKLVMAHLLPRFQFTDVLGHSGELEWFLVQKMKDGFVVDVAKRKLSTGIS
jgi:cytochrome P450